MEQSNHLKAISQYYKGLREQSVNGFDMPVAHSYAIDLVEQLTAVDELLPIYGGASLDMALTLPQSEQEAIDHLCFMPIEQLGPLLGEMPISANDIKMWHGKALLHIPYIKRSYLENTVYRHRSEEKPTAIRRELQSTNDRLKKFAAGVLSIPDFTEEKYVHDLQRSRAVDLALIRALTWGSMVSARQCQNQITLYDEVLGSHMSDQLDDMAHVQRDNPKD